jgi:predicted nucleic acid-binding protein
MRRVLGSCSTRSEKSCISDEARLIDTNVLVHAYAISDERKHEIALSLVERVWAGEGAVTTLQNVCELFFVVTQKVASPMSAASAEAIVQGILGALQWRIIDRGAATVSSAIELVKLHRAPFWGALIAPCMLEHGVRTLVTENERDFKRIPGITVFNPFKARVVRRERRGSGG